MSTIYLMKTAAGILAGGQARRFNGIAKGLLRDRRDDTIVCRLERHFRQSGLEEIVLLTNNYHSYDSLGIPILPDLRPGLGPLAAIESGLEHFASSLWGDVICTLRPSEFDHPRDSVAARSIFQRQVEGSRRTNCGGRNAIVMRSVVRRVTEKNYSTS